MSQHESPSESTKKSKSTIASERRESREIAPQVREADLEPYDGLRYLAKLFRLMALVMIVLLAAEIAAGLTTRGLASVPTLIREAGRFLVLAGMLWGTGDLAVLLIDVGHDVRATRILLGRQATRRESAQATTDPV